MSEGLVKGANVNHAPERVRLGCVTHATAMTHSVFD